MVESKNCILKPIPESYSNLWEQFKTGHPDLFGLLSRMSTGFIIRSHRNTQVEDRANLSVAGFLGRRFGFDEERRSLSQLSKELGMTIPGVGTLAQGVLGYISSETGLPFNPSIGKNAGRHVEQFSRLVQEQRILENRMQQPLAPITQAAVRLYLLGYRFDDLAVKLNQDLGLTSRVSENSVTDIINQVLGRIDRRRVAFFPARAFKARSLLEEAQSGTYVNYKARATIRLLSLIENGYTPDKIVEETGIRYQDYYALIHEVFRDLEGDSVGREGLAEACRTIAKEPFEPLGSKAKNRVAGLLCEPYKEFRVRLGDQVTDSEGSIHNRLSVRERKILESIATGSMGIDVAAEFDLGRTYYSTVSRWLLGETGFISRDERLAERRRMFTCLQDDLKEGRHIPDKLLTFAGRPSTLVLELLADGTFFTKAAEEISRQGDCNVTKSDVMNFFSKVRAHYRN